MTVIACGMSAALLVAFAVGTSACGSSADSLHDADVVVTAAGLLDDSVRASRFDLRLARQGDQSWRLTRARWSQQCQPNRGHQDFTTRPCI